MHPNNLVLQLYLRNAVRLCRELSPYGFLSPLSLLGLACMHIEKANQNYFKQQDCALMEAYKNLLWEILARSTIYKKKE